MADIGCNVEEEWKPAHPIKELSFANFSDLGVEALYGREYLAEERYDPQVFIRWRTLQSRVMFANVEARDEYSATQRDARDNAQHLELCIAEMASGQRRKVYVA